MSSLIVIPLMLSLLAAAFWLWMAWDLGGNNDITGNERFYWQLAFIFMNVFAAVFYYVNVYKKKVLSRSLLTPRATPTPLTHFFHFCLLSCAIGFACAPRLLMALMEMRPAISPASGWVALSMRMVRISP